MKLDFIEKIGSFGTFFVASACPVCWPLFVPIGTALGFSFLKPYESTMMDYVFPGFVLLALIGSFFAYRVHHAKYPLIVSVLSVLFIAFGFYGGWHLELMYIGIIGLLIGSIMGIIAKRKFASICEVPSANGSK